MALTKADIVEEIAARNDGMSNREASRLTEGLLEIIKRTLESGEDVMVSGFGKFVVKDKRRRRGRNPATGDAMLLKPRRVITFHCSGILRRGINGE